MASVKVLRVRSHYFHVNCQSEFYVMTYLRSTRVFPCVSVRTVHRSLDLRLLAECGKCICCMYYYCYLNKVGHGVFQRELQMVLITFRYNIIICQCRDVFCLHLWKFVFKIRCSSSFTIKLVFPKLQIE